MKTFLYLALYYYYWAQNYIILYMAFSKIAALLLPKKQTFYSQFKILLTYIKALIYNII